MVLIAENRPPMPDDTQRLAAVFFTATRSLACHTGSLQQRLADTYADWKGSLSASIVEQRLSRCERDSHLPPEEFVARWVPEMFTSAAPPALLEEMSGVFADFHPLGFRLMAKSLADTDTTDLLPTIRARTLILWGEDDRRSSMATAEQLRNAIRGAELQVIARAGHVSNMEQPAAFTSQVRRFCLAS